MAKKSSFANMTIVLTAICLVCSTLLGLVYSMTAEPIKSAELAKTNKAIAVVVPAFDNVPSQEAKSVSCNGKEYRVYPALKGGEPVGYAIEVAPVGFGGAIKMIVGFTCDGNIYNTSVVSHSETPGLGAKITDIESHFRTQFKNKDPKDYKLSVKKDGGDVDAITASTISSRAFVQGVSEAYQVYLKIREDL